MSFLRKKTLKLRLLLQECGVQLPSQRLCASLECQLEHRIFVTYLLLLCLHSVVETRWFYGIYFCLITASVNALVLHFHSRYVLNQSLIWLQFDQLLLPDTWLTIPDWASLRIQLRRWMLLCFLCTISTLHLCLILWLSYFSTLLMYLNGVCCPSIPTRLNFFRESIA